MTSRIPLAEPGSQGDRPLTGTVLVVARSPVPGRAKTRLAATIGPDAAADLAAAALLDTLDAALGSGSKVVVALTGDLGLAARRRDVQVALAATSVIAQRGQGLGERLGHAHADTHALTNGPVFQVGMDTPQLTSALLVRGLAATAAHDAALGPATDGGWWGLGVTDPGLAHLLTNVAMSTGRTGSLTRAALESTGADVGGLPTLRDVDEWTDAQAVAEQVPDGRFAPAVRSVARAIQAPSSSGGLG